MSGTAWLRCCRHLPPFDSGAVSCLADFGNAGLEKSVVSPAAGAALLRQLWERGQRWWVLSVGSNSPSNSTDSPAALALVNQTRAALEVTDAAGWPRENLMVYVSLGAECLLLCLVACVSLPVGLCRCCWCSGAVACHAGCSLFCTFVLVTLRLCRLTTDTCSFLIPRALQIGDEIGGPLLQGVLAQSAAVKAIDPRLKVVTCGRNQWARRIRHLEWPWLPDADTPIQHFKDVDFFIPYTVGYANTSLSTLAAVRKAGQKAGWYTSGVPSGHGSLNCKQHTRRFEAHDLHSRCELVCCLCASYVALASEWPVRNNRVRGVPRGAEPAADGHRRLEAQGRHVPLLRAR